MNKKTAIWWIAWCLFFGIPLTGCGPMGQVRNVVSASKEEGRGNGEGEETKKGETAENGEEEGTASKTPVLGAENVEGCDGFAYLYEEVLTAYIEEEKESGKIKRKMITVYIPKGDESGINADFPGTAYANALGVAFHFSLNPYLMQGQEDYSVAERLQGYVDGIYREDGAKKDAYDTDYEDVEISDIQRMGKDAAAITVKYCLCDDWEEEYRVCYSTYYVKELEPDVLALLEVEIDSKEADDRTPELLKELEAFYEVDLEWDSEGAQKKLEDYLAKRDEDDGIPYIIEFQFPEGWEIDRSYSYGETVIYAPGGDSDGAKCGIGIATFYIGEGDYDDEYYGWLYDTENMADFIKEGLGDSVQDFVSEYYGETCIGETTLMEFCYNEDGEMVDGRLYMGRNGEYIYLVVAVQYQWLEMNTFEIVEELLENGILKD